MRRFAALALGLLLLYAQVAGHACLCAHAHGPSHEHPDIEHANTSACSHGGGHHHQGTTPQRPDHEEPLPAHCPCPSPELFRSPEAFDAPTRARSQRAALSAVLPWLFSMSVSTQRSIDGLHPPRLLPGLRGICSTSPMSLPELRI